jgi:Bacterial Ig-like domain (group 1)
VTRIRTNSRFQAALTVIAVLAALALPLSGVAVANHGSRTLQVTPETNSQGVGTVHTLTATLSSAADLASGAINIDFENEAGPNDNSGPPNFTPEGNTPMTPDLTCSIPSGQSSCQVSYQGNTTGTDTWRAWIDHDGLNSTVEADEDESADAGASPNEPGDAVGNPGTGCSKNDPPDGTDPPDPSEPDCTDVVTATWTAGAPTTVDCDDASGPNTEQEVNPSGGGSSSNETYTCTVKDAQGNNTDDFDPTTTGVQPIKVFGEVENGVNDPDATDGPSYDSPDYNCTVSSGGGSNPPKGTCTVSVTQNEAEQGTAEICFWGDDDDTNTPGGGGGPNDGDVFCATEPTNEAQNPDGSDVGNDLADQVEKTWANRQASGVDAEPETDTNDFGQNHVITATVYDQFGATFAGNTVVNFEFFQGSPSDTDGNTPASPDKSCTTSNNSSCTITYTQNTTAGKDLICAWVGTNPAMQGTNTNGTCDGEGLTDPDDAAGSADAPEPETDDVDVVEKNWVNPNSPSRLDCEPETDSNPTGTAHEITCTARNSSDATVSGAKIDMEATGANDPDGNAQLTNPDFTCTTGQDGTCKMTHGPGNTNNPGVTTYRAWIDSDDQNTSTEADETEQRDSSTQAGAGADAEPDDTDVMEKTWTGGPANLTMEPPTDSASVGTCNAFTITVTDQANQPVSGVIIDVEQRHEKATNQTANDEPTVSFCTPTAADGPNPTLVDETKGDLRPPDENPDNPGTAGGETSTGTDSAGKVTIGIRVAGGQGSDGSGTVTVEAFVDSTDNDDPDQAEPKDTSTKTWVVSDARTLDCEPETSSHTTGESQVITCTARDRFGSPVSGEVVNFTSTGVGSVSPTTATTNAQGQATTTATSSAEGTQTVTGTLGDDTTGAEPGEVDECDKAAGDPTGAPAGACSDDVTVTWTEPPVTECSDGIDNDGDGQVDFPADPGCDDAQDDTEVSEGSETIFADSEVTIGYGKGAFKGQVTSTDDRCEPQRVVKIKKAKPGKDGNAGSDTTNAQGRYRVSKPNADGRYYARVAKREITLATGDVLVCRGARSSTIKV